MNFSKRKERRVKDGFEAKEEGTQRSCVGKENSNRTRKKASAAEARALGGVMFGSRPWAVQDEC